MNTRNFLALDLGAESGRAILGRIDGDQLKLNEVHRFSNNPVYIGNRFYWNPLSLFIEMKHGLAHVETTKNICLDAVGIDTWGVDFALLDKNDTLLDNPRNYRDDRTNGFPQKAFEEVTKVDIFAQTGIQFLKINTLYQLISMRDTTSLDLATTFLMMPDLFNFFLLVIKLPNSLMQQQRKCIIRILGLGLTIYSKDSDCRQTFYRILLSLALSLEACVAQYEKS